MILFVLVLLHLRVVVVKDEFLRLLSPLSWLLVIEAVGRDLNLVETCLEILVGISGLEQVSSRVVF